MKTRTSLLNKTSVVLALAALGFSSATAHAQSPLTIKLDKNAWANAPVIPPDFMGLSYETAKVLPDTNGKYYFGPANKPLIALFKTLGIKSLRVGGNTADRETVKVPAPADLDALFAFAKAADVKVIYTLRMKKGDPKAAAETAKYIMEHYRPELSCFAIGNEPNVFAKEYPLYRDEWKKYMEAIVAPENAPAAKFCGPCATPGKVTWARDFANDFGPSGRIAMVAQHDYPGGSAKLVTDVAAARDQMLSPDWPKKYEKFYAKFVPAAVANKLPFRLEEANSFFYGGAKDVSDTFASALWVLDYAYWWAAHGCAGINFHTGDNVAAGAKNTPSRYAAFTTMPGGYTVHPIGYGMMAFALGGRSGKVVQAIPTANADKVNLTAYLVRHSDFEVFTLINKEHGPGAREASVSIVTDAQYDTANATFLAAPKGDVSVTSGVTFGGAEVRPDGGWQLEKRTPLNVPSAYGTLTVNVPPATAVVVFMDMSRF